MMQSKEHSKALISKQGETFYEFLSRGNLAVIYLSGFACAFCAICCFADPCRLACGAVGLTGFPEGLGRLMGWWVWWGK